MGDIVIGSPSCFIKGCARPRTANASMRGLCLVCYGKAKKKVEAGETTWDKLAEMGLCEKDKDPFDDAYARALKGMEEGTSDPGAGAP